MRAIILAALLAPTLASAADLGAPLVPKPPTLGSEIHRGADAAIACHALSPILQTADYRACIEAAHDRNRQAMGRGYEAFDAGLYFEEKRSLDIVLQVISARGGDVSLLRGDADLANSLYDAARDAIGVTDDQVRGAAVYGS